MAVVIHFLRLRFKALSQAIHVVMLAEPIVAQPNTGDQMLDQFECYAKVGIGVYDPQLQGVIASRQTEISTILTKALGLALTDPVARYSKQKMERTLRLALGTIIDVRHIADVSLVDMRQRRAQKPPPE